MSCLLVSIISISTCISILRVHVHINCQTTPIDLFVQILSVSIVMSGHCDAFDDQNPCLYVCRFTCWIN